MDELIKLAFQGWQMFVDHAYAGVGGIICMIFMVLLSKRATFFRDWDSPWRTFLGTLIGAVGLTLQLVQAGGTEMGSAIVSLVATTLPTLVAEFEIIRRNRKSGGGTSAALTGDAGSPRPQPAGSLQLDSDIPPAILPAAGRTFRLPAMATLTLALVLSAGCAQVVKNVGQVKWPEAAKCSVEPLSDLIGVISRVLFTDAGIGELSPSGKAKLEELALQKSAETVLCVVNQLRKDWKAPGASASPERTAALGRAEEFLASTHTKIE